MIDIKIIPQYKVEKTYNKKKVGFIMIEIKKTDLNKHFDILCRKIGNRYSGSRGEKKGAEYIVTKMIEFGLETQVYPFKFLNWRPKKIKATVIKNGKERKIPNVGPFTYSPSTCKEGLKGEVVYLESLQPLIFKNRNLKGKIALYIGALDLGNPTIAKRIMDSGIAGLLAVDDRLPFTWRIPIGMAPQWAKDYSLPTVAIPYMEAIKLEKLLPASVRLNIDAVTETSLSQNVVGEIIGNKFPKEIIIVSAHTDSVLYNSGADDNASGCAFVLELARVLKSCNPKRTIRFICYGVEEKLSLGAYLYTQSLKKTERENILIGINADSIGSRIGQNVAICTGGSELSLYFKNEFGELDYPVQIRNEVNPYSDHFPLNIYGIPSIWATRINLCNSGWWTLHSKHDNMNNLNLDICLNTISVYASILTKLSKTPNLPFPRKIPSNLMREIKVVAKNLYRHPWNPDQ